MIKSELQALSRQRHKKRNGSERKLHFRDPNISNRFIWNSIPGKPIKPRVTTEPVSFDIPREHNDALCKHSTQPDPEF